MARKQILDYEKEANHCRIVAALLKDGRATVKGLYSEKTGKKYDATVILDDSGNGFVNFKLCFK